MSHSPLGVLFRYVGVRVSRVFKYSSSMGYLEARSVLESTSRQNSLITSSRPRGEGSLSSLSLSFSVSLAFRPTDILVLYFLAKTTSYYAPVRRRNWEVTTNSEKTAARAKTTGKKRKRISEMDISSSLSVSIQSICCTETRTALIYPGSR